MDILKSNFSLNYFMRKLIFSCFFARFSFWFSLLFSVLLFHHSLNSLFLLLFLILSDISYFILGMVRSRVEWNRSIHSLCIKLPRFTFATDNINLLLTPNTLVFISRAYWFYVSVPYVYGDWCMSQRGNTINKTRLYIEGKWNRNEIESSDWIWAYQY